MTEWNKDQNRLIIKISDVGYHDLHRFRKGLLAVLAKVSIENCEPEFKESLKSVYELLSHLRFKGSSFNDCVSYEHKKLTRST